MPAQHSSIDRSHSVSSLSYAQEISVGRSRRVVGLTIDVRSGLWSGRSA